MGSAPTKDIEDKMRGAKSIPGPVTAERRAGKEIKFEQQCSPNCWYWQMPDGSRHYHMDESTFVRIASRNKRKPIGWGNSARFQGGPGPCPDCGNTYTSGGRHEKPRGGWPKLKKIKKKRVK